MVIHLTRHPARRGIDTRPELGELVGGTGALTPAPQAHSADPEGALAVTMPWQRAILRIRTTVSFAIEQAYA